MYTINPMPEQVAAGDLQLLSGSRQPLSDTGASSVSCTVPSSRSSRSAVWSALPSPSPYRARIPPCFTT